MPIDANSIPFFDQYFGIWAMHEASFWAQFNLAKTLNLAVHMAGPGPQNAKESAKAEKPPVVGIATVTLDGKLMKQASSMLGGTSTVATRNKLRGLATNPAVAAVMLLIDSPGGTVAGTEELAADVAALAKIKPVHAFIDDLGASAAYWVASQASFISTNPSGLVGSIGTYGAIFDYSGAAAMEGVKAYVVRAGKFKGMGTPGTEITQEHLAELQRNVDALNARFLSGVATGRRMNSDRVAELADGRVHIGAEALALGLVDAVNSYDAAMQRLAAQVTNRSTKTMQAEHVNPISSKDAIEVATEIKSAGPATAQAASYEQLKAGCYGADAAFIVAQLDAKASLPDAQSAWMQAQQLKIAEANQRAEQAKAAASRPGVAPISGAEPTGNQVAAGGSATEQFWGLVKEQRADGRTKDQAILKVVSENPDLHAAMLAENKVKRRGR